MTKILLALLALLLLGAAAACNDDGDGGSASGVTSDDSLPDDFPVFEGSEFDAGGVSDDGDLSTFLGTWRTDASPEEVQDFFEDAFGEGPWQVVGSEETDNGIIIRVEREGDGEPESGVVVIREENGETVIGKEVTKGEPDPDDEDENDDDDEDLDGDEDPDTQPTPGTGNGLPAGYPADRAPLPSDATIESAQGPDDLGNGLYVVEFRSTSSPAALAQYWSDELTARGWTPTGNTGDQNNFLLQFADGFDTLSVSGGASSSGSIANITIQLGN